MDPEVKYQEFAARVFEVVKLGSLPKYEEDPLLNNLKTYESTEEAKNRWTLQSDIEKYISECYQEILKVQRKWHFMEVTHLKKMLDDWPEREARNGPENEESILYMVNKAIEDLK
jgi:hypothetical protein